LRGIPILMWRHPYAKIHNQLSDRVLLVVYTQLELHLIFGGTPILMWRHPNAKTNNQLSDRVLLVLYTQLELHLISATVGTAAQLRPERSLSNEDTTHGQQHQ